jgi:hypothetical protein
MFSSLTVTARRSGVMLVAVAVALLGTLAGTASAFTYWKSGTPGNVSNNGMAGMNLMVMDGGRTIQESPTYSNRDQRVCITTRLWSVVYAGAGTSDSPFWKINRQHQRCGVIPAGGTSIRDNGVYFADLNPGTFYAVDVVVKWTLLNGTQLGSMTMDWNAAGDYQCQQSTWRCSTGNVNWGYRDAFITFN